MNDFVLFPFFLAPIFREAAETLAENEYSCNAVARVAVKYNLPFRPFEDFLQSLGLQTSSASQFPSELSPEELWSWRYAWLSFVTDLAEEWGVEG